MEGICNHRSLQSQSFKSVQIHLRKICQKWEVALNIQGVSYQM
jgi:hypothetical protein